MSWRERFKRYAVVMSVMIGAMVAGCARTSPNDSSAGEMVAVETQMQSQGAVWVSMVQLIARPEDFHGKWVKVCGVHSAIFEGTGLYLSREDLDFYLMKNGVAMGRGDTKLQGRYVMVEGKFDADRRGHGGLWSGSIMEVRKIQAWPVSDATTRPSK